MKLYMFRNDHLCWGSGQLLSEANILLASESLAWKQSVTERSEKFGLEATLKPFLKHPVFTTDDPSTSVFELFCLNDMT